MRLVPVVLVGELIAGAAAQDVAPRRDIVHVYDLRDAVLRLMGPADGAGGAPADAEDPEASKKREVTATATLIEGLRILVAEAGVAAPTSVTPTGGTVVIAASRETHRVLREVVAGLAAAPVTLCRIEAKIYMVSAAAWKQVVEPRLAAGRPTGQPARQAVLLEAKSAADLLAALGATEGIDSLMAPRLAKLPLGPATLEAAESISYIERFDIRETPTGHVADPVIGIVKDGVCLAVGASLPGANGVATTFTATMSHVARPIASKKIKAQIAGRETELTIQEPKVTEARGQATGVFPEKTPIFLPLPEHKGKRPLVVVTLTRQ